VQEGVVSVILATKAVLRLTPVAGWKAPEVVGKSGESESWPVTNTSPLKLVATPLT